MKSFENHLNKKYKINIIDELIGKFNLKNKNEFFEISVDIVKNILKIDSVRQNYLYRKIGRSENAIYPGGFNLFKENLFKAKLFPLSVDTSFEKSEDGVTGVSSMSVIYAGRTVGKPNPGKTFTMGIFLVDYLIAIDKEITMTMAAEMEPYQLAILRLNPNIDNQTRLYAELNWE